jgi:hypothetical protein
MKFVFSISIFKSINWNSLDLFLLEIPHEFGKKNHNNSKPKKKKEILLFLFNFPFFIKTENHDLLKSSFPFANFVSLFIFLKLKF